MSRQPSRLSERRSSHPVEWLEAICTEFSTVTGWDLRFFPVENESADGFDRRMLDWCWHATVSDGQQTVGVFQLDLPGLKRPALEFESAWRLADLLARQAGRILESQRQILVQSEEIGSLVATACEDADDIRQRLAVLLRACACLANYRSAALFVLEPEGRSIRFRLGHQIADGAIPARRRMLAATTPDLTALETGCVTVSRDDAHAPLWLPESMATGVCVAVENRSGPVGTLWLYDRRARRPDETERELLTGFSRQIADVFERLLLLHDRQNQSRLSRELRIVAQTTNECRDLSEPFPGCEVASRICSRHEIGGDLCEVLRVDGQRTLVVLGDASGNSIPAAMVVAATRGALHTLLESGRHDPSETATLVTALNRGLLRVTGAHHFMTLVLALFDAADGSITWTNAGHPAPLLIRGSEVFTLDSQGMLLGVIDLATYTAGRIETRPGDMLIGFSDGITEARNRTQLMFRNEGILNSLNGHRPDSARETLDLIWNRCELHSDNGELDDRALFVLRVNDPEPAAPEPDGQSTPAAVVPV